MQEKKPLNKAFKYSLNIVGVFLVAFLILIGWSNRSESEVHSKTPEKQKNEACSYFCNKCLGNSQENCSEVVCQNDSCSVARSNYFECLNQHNICVETTWCKKEFREYAFCLDPWFFCGDGEIGGDEECDDGNTQSEDGCSSQCRLEK